MQFGVFEKFTSAYLFQIAWEKLWLPVNNIYIRTKILDFELCSASYLCLVVGALWLFPQESALNFGTLYHELLSIYILCQLGNSPWQQPLREGCQAHRLLLFSYELLRRNLQEFYSGPPARNPQYFCHAPFVQRKYSEHVSSCFYFVACFCF